MKTSNYTAEHFLFLKHSSSRVFIILFSFFTSKWNQDCTQEEDEGSVFWPCVDNPSYLMSLILPNQCLRPFSPGFGRSYSKAAGSESFWIKQMVWSWLEEIWHICLCLIFDTCVDIHSFSSCYCWMISFQQKPGLTSLICLWWGDYNLISESHTVTLRLCQLQGVLPQTVLHVHLETARHANDKPFIGVGDR